MFPDGTVAGANASLGYFIPAGRRLSIPVKLLPVPPIDW